MFPNTLLRVDKFSEDASTVRSHTLSAFLSSYRFFLRRQRIIFSDLHNPKHATVPLYLPLMPT